MYMLSCVVVDVTLQTRHACAPWAILRFETGARIVENTNVFVHSDCPAFRITRGICNWIHS